MSLEGVSTYPTTLKETKGREIAGRELFANSIRFMRPFEQKVVEAMFRNVRAQWTLNTEATVGFGASEVIYLNLLDQDDLRQTLLEEMNNARGDTLYPGMEALSKVLFASSNRGLSIGSVFKPFEIMHSLGTMAEGNCLNRLNYGRTNCLEQMASVVVISKTFPLLDISEAVIIPYTMQSIGTGSATHLMHDHYGVLLTTTDGEKWIMINSGAVMKMKAMEDELGELSSENIREFVALQVSQEKNSPSQRQLLRQDRTTSIKPSTQINREARGIAGHLAQVYRAQKKLLREERKALISG
ncbi:MAG TPA: hypothetical protein PKG71_03050 [Candidatus Woesebacteria bacterium]|nr:hypothetical protein [Candidatus Woesebacteria bacterium]HNS94920.1 hypothetical protein [Candidatus Woesebacteria bacterium]